MDSNHASPRGREKSWDRYRFRLRPLSVVGVMALGSRCASPGPGEDIGQSAQALSNMTWIIPPVIQQTHTIGSVADFSVVYVAVGGNCGNTTIPCVSSDHNLWVSFHGQNTWSVAATLPAYNGSSGLGYVVSDAHMGDGSIDCQKPDQSGLCGTSTTYYDVGPGLTPLEGGKPPWKVLKAMNLAPDTDYDWKVIIGGDANNNPLDSSQSYIGRLKTPPTQTGSHSGSFKFVFNSDPQQNTPWDGSSASEQGGGDAYRDTILQAVKQYSAPDFMVSGGDLNVDSGGMKLGRHWFNDLSSGTPSTPTSVLSSIPFFPAMGNHDWMGSGSLDHWDCCQGNSGPPMDRLWNATPTAAMMYGYTTGGLSSITEEYLGNAPTSFVPYYSFDWGNSHFVILSTGPDSGNDNGPSLPVWGSTANVGIDSNQFAWLANDLAAHNKTTTSTQHIFVAMHDPPFHTYGDSSYPVNYPVPYPCPAPPQTPPLFWGPTCSPPSGIGPNRGEKGNPYNIDQLVALFTSSNVDIVLGGHVHIYEHVINKGVHYVTAGIAGGGIDDPTQYFWTGPPLVTAVQAQLNHNASNADGGATQFANTGGYWSAHYNDNWPGYAKMFWGYVEITVNGAEVTANAVSVLPGYTNGSITQPVLPPQASLTTVETFTVGMNPPTNFSVVVHDGISGTTGGTVDLRYNVNASVSGVTQLSTSTDGVTFTHEAAYDTAFGAGASLHTIFAYPMTPGQVKYFSLVNVEGSITSQPSATLSIVFPACQMPGSLTTTYNASAPGAPITVGWPSGYTCSGATFQRYAVQRWDVNAANPFGVWNTIAALADVNAVSFSDTGYLCANALTGGTAPTYQVIAQTTIGGNQVPSLPNSNAPSSIPGWPTPDGTHCTITALTAKQQGASPRVELDWSNNGQMWSGAISVARYGSSCIGAAQVVSVGGSALQLFDTTVQPGTQYCYVASDPSGKVSDPTLITTWTSYPPNMMKAAPGLARVFLSWSYPATSLATATTIYRYLASQSADPTQWTPVITLDNPQPSGSVNQWTDHSDGLAQWYGPGATGDTTYYYQAVGHAYSINVDPQSYALTKVDNASAPGPVASATPVSTTACAGSMLPDTIFSPGMAACGGSVTWDQRNILCAAGYTACTAVQWTANYGGVPPVNDYWTNDNLGYAGAGPGNCEATTTSEGNCGTDDPMRVCGATTDAYGNQCNWTGCGLNATGDQYFGGCVGDMTAGTLCCLDNPTTMCEPFANVLGVPQSPQYYAPGVAGCPGTTTWDQRNNLCAQGCTACSAAQYDKYRSGLTPAYDYWTNDNLGYGGSGPNACGAYTGGGYSCGANTPMRVCVPGTTTDSLGNVCNWYGCGLNGNTPGTANDYFGGCSGDTSAGTVCCRNQ